MSTMIHAKYLNESLTIRGGAAEIFFRHRDEYIKEKSGENSDYDSLPQEDYIRDKFEFPTFHVNWIDGILTSCLKILNHVGAISAFDTPITNNTPPDPPDPVYDPFFVFKYLSENHPTTAVIPPQLDINGIASYFQFPGIKANLKLAADLGLATYPDPTNPQNTAFDNGMPQISSFQSYKKPLAEDYIPEFISEEFPELDYEGELSLKDKQTLLYKAVVQSFDDLVQEVKKNPNILLFPIAALGVSPGTEKLPNDQAQPGPGLMVLFTKAKEILKKNFPGLKAENAITNEVNYEALIRTLVKPLYLTTIGVFFGSHEEGFVGKMGNITPDAVNLLNEEYSDPQPQKLGIEEQAIEYAEQFSESALYDPDDANRNGVPIMRSPMWGAKSPYKHVGTGMKNEVYQKLKEIGKNYIASGICNNNADDNHKGIIIMMVLNHETALDPGIGNTGSKDAGYKIATPSDFGRITDAMIWAANNVQTGTGYIDMKKPEFQRSLVFNPNDPNIAGLPVMKQLHLYEQYLIRVQCLPRAFQLRGPSKPTGNKPAGDHVNGPDPHVEKWARGEGRKLFAGGGEGMDATFNAYKGRRLLMQTPYDLYALHGDANFYGPRLASTGTSDSRKHKFMTIVRQAVELKSFTEEHLPRYMKANGMSSIDWDQVGVPGIKLYINAQGQRTGETFPRLKDDSPQQSNEWFGKNSVEIIAYLKKYADRENNNK